MAKPLTLENVNGDEYATGWNSKNLHDDEIKSLDTGHLPKVIYFNGSRLAFEFNNSVPEQEKLTYTYNENMNL